MINLEQGQSAHVFDVIRVDLHVLKYMRACNLSQTGDHCSSRRDAIQDNETLKSKEIQPG
jgi:hypothetical protein